MRPRGLIEGCPAPAPERSNTLDHTGDRRSLRAPASARTRPRRRVHSSRATWWGGILRRDHRAACSPAESMFHRVNDVFQGRAPSPGPAVARTPLCVLRRRDRNTRYPAAVRRHRVPAHDYLAPPVARSEDEVFVLIAPERRAQIRHELRMQRVYASPSLGTPF